MTLIDPDQDPEGDPEVMTMILGIAQEMDQDIDMENTKMKEDEKNSLSGNDYVGFSFLVFMTFT